MPSCTAGSLALTPLPCLPRLRHPPQVTQQNLIGTAIALAGVFAYSQVG